MPKLIDRYLLFRLRTKRDPEAYGRLYDRYVAQIYRFVSFKLPTKEAAQDVTSEAFLRLWQHVLQEKEIRNLRALLYRIARNLVADHYRQAEPSVSIEASVTNWDESTSSIDESQLSDLGRGKTGIEAQADFAIVLEQIARLKEDYRDVLLLRLVEGLGYRDIAIILEKTPGAVRVIYHRALKALENA